MEEEEAGYDVVTGAERVLHLHARRPASRSRITTSTRSAATTSSPRSSIRRPRRATTPAPGGLDYSNTFTCIPALRHLPARPGSRPSRMVKGPQTAVVVGPGGRGDLHRQVRPGQGPVPLGPRRGRRTRTARAGSASPSSGPARTGASSPIPRIGQEVIVDFLEGDPDRPIDHRPRLQRRADAPLRPAGQQDPERHQDPQHPGRHRRPTSTRSASRTRRAPSRSTSTPRRTRTSRSRTTRPTGSATTARRPSTTTRPPTSSTTAPRPSTATRRSPSTATAPRRSTRTRRSPSTASRTEEVDKDETITIHGSRTEDGRQGREDHRSTAAAPRRSTRTRTITIDGGRTETSPRTRRSRSTAAAPRRSPRTRRSRSTAAAPRRSPRTRASRSPATVTHTVNENDSLTVARC